MKPRTDFILINQLLQHVCREAGQVEIVTDFAGSEGARNGGMGINFIINLRLKGDTRPAVIFGFDSIERVRGREKGSILGAPGVFYLKLPCPLSHIKMVFEKAVGNQVPMASGVDETNHRRYAIQRVRAFKHTCDNVWMAIEANANRAKRFLKTDVSKVLAVIGEIKQSRMERLQEECYQIAPLVELLGLKSADRLRPIMDDVMLTWSAMHQGDIPPDRIISLAFECAAKMETISEILSAAKELTEND